MKTSFYLTILAFLVVTVGCEQLPGTRDQQATAAGTAAGAAVGAVLADEDNQLMGALLGGALGAGGGYLLGAKTDILDDRETASAQAEQAIEEAQQNPATVDQVLASNTADVDDDGFVTMDELIAMEEAGLSDDEIMSRLRATDAVFDLSRQQADELVTAGVSPEVVNQLEDINREERDQVIGRLEQ
ncbi:hypothetical protein F6455_07380 [Proteobacteria bacterium 005FR1]|nr:hypothetical protein [Proteobacteria bacterium 005FR1]